jgi:hypothetical protein
MIAFGIVGLATSPFGVWGKHAPLWQLIPIFSLNILSGFFLLVEGRQMGWGTRSDQQRPSGFLGFVLWIVFGPQVPAPRLEPKPSKGAPTSDVGDPKT